MNDNIPELKIERLSDGTGEGLILLTQDNCGNSDSVAIHPIHLRLMAEKMGLVESTDPQAQKTIAMLTRRLELLSDRVHFLANYLRNNSDHKHADLDYETTYARATSDIAYEFCTELMGVQACTETPKPTAKPPTLATGANPRQLSIDA